MLVEVVALLLLLTVVAELGWIIIRGGKRFRESQTSLGAVQNSLDDVRSVLAELQKRLIELPQRVGDELPRALPKIQLSLPPSSIPGAPATVKRESPPSPPTITDVPTLLPVLRELSESLKGLRPASSDLAHLELRHILEGFAAHLEIASERLHSYMDLALERMDTDRRQLLDSLSAHISTQQSGMSDLISTLKEVLSRDAANTQPRRPRGHTDSKSPGDGSQPEVTGEGGKDAMDSFQSGGRQAAAPRPDAPAGSASEGDGFAPLQDWVVSHIDQIMNRSLNQWSRPEELLRDAPPELRYTARLLDPDSKLVLVGVEGVPRYLALILPGGQLGANYYDWFNSPTGVGVRVERTIAPAVLSALKTGYSILERGAISYH